jgi:hypothetical protein
LAGIESGIAEPGALKQDAWIFSREAAVFFAPFFASGKAVMGADFKGAVHLKRNLKI